MNKYLLVTALSFMTFLNVMCHKDKQPSALLVTRRAQPHTPEELLEITKKIITDEQQSQGNTNEASNLYSMRQRALAEALILMMPADRVKLGELLLWFNSFDQRTGSAFKNTSKRNRAASVPAEPTSPHKPSPERSKSAPDLNK